DEVRSLVDDQRDLVKEPGIHTGGLVEPFDGNTPPDRGFQVKGTVRGGNRRPPDQLVVLPRRIDSFGWIAIEAQAAPLDRPEPLLQRLPDRPTDRHGLPDRLHPGPEDVGDAGKLLEGPARDLGHDVIDGGFEAGWRLAGDVVLDLVEGVADRQAGRDLGDGK